MEFRALSFGIILLMLACNRAEPDEQAAVDPFVEDTASSVVYEPSEALWVYDYDQQTQDFEVKQVRQVDRDTLSASTVEKITNSLWPRVQVKYVKTSNDTVYILIPDSEVLTQQMGTAGAQSFLISTTFSFTELLDVNFVSYDFEEGDHGIPGVYSRNSWNKAKSE